MSYDLRMPTFAAKYGGKCRICGHRYTKGNVIVSNGKGQGASHYDCARLVWRVSQGPIKRR